MRAENAVTTFRSFTAGPWEVGMAKELAPQSIRGRYGLDNVLSAIHCTDLEEDGISEVLIKDQKHYIFVCIFGWM